MVDTSSPVAELVLAAEAEHLPPVVPGLPLRVLAPLHVVTLGISLHAVDRKISMTPLIDTQNLHLEDTRLEILPQEVRVGERLVGELEVPVHNVPAGAAVVEKGDDSFNLKINVSRFLPT